MSSQEITCLRCNLPQAIRMGKWWTRCTRKTCVKSDVNLVLALIEAGRKYVHIVCKKGIIRRIYEDTTIVRCSCCKDEPTEFAVDDSQIGVVNGEKIYGSVALDGFIRRRLDELQKTKEKLEAVEEELKKLGLTIPILKKKEGRRDKDVEKICYLAPKTFKTSCNSCGTPYTIPPGCFTIACRNQICQRERFVCRPVPTGVKYVLINCEKTTLQATLEKSVMVSCACCNKDFVIDNVLYKVMSGQPVYKAEPITGFTQGRCMELVEMRRKLKYAEAELQKHNKEPSFWKRLFTSSKPETKRNDVNQPSEGPSTPLLYPDLTYHCGKHNEGFLETPEDLPPLCNISMTTVKPQETPLKENRGHPQEIQTTLKKNPPAATKILTDATTALENLNVSVEPQEPQEMYRFSLQLHSLATYDDWLHDTSVFSCGVNERLIE